MNRKVKIPQIKLPGHRVINLCDNVGLVVMERRLIPSAVVRVIIRGGASEDLDGKEGLHRLASKMLKQGSGKYSAHKFAYLVESKGASVSVHTTYDYIIISGQFLSRDITFGLELLAGMIRRPQFKSIEIERLRKKTIGEIKSIIDEPAQLCGVLHNHNLFCGHPYGRRIIGSEKSVMNITEDDIARIHREKFLKSRILITVVGDVNTEEIVSRAGSFFGGITGPQVIETDIKSRMPVSSRTFFIVDKPDLTQTHIRIGNIGMARTDPDIFKLKVANTMFGGCFTSRLNEEIRVKRGLTYGIRSSVTTNKLPGSVQISTFTKTENTATALKLIFSEMEKLGKKEIGNQELYGSQQYVTGLFPLSLETDKSIAQQLSDMYFYGLPSSFLEDYCENIAQVSSSDVSEIAKKYFSASNAVITLLGDTEKIIHEIREIDKVVLQKFNEVYEKI